ncbi:hypothetical protein Bca101_034237 [Brassica carinata]
MDCFCTLKYCVQNPLVVTNTNNPRPHHPSHGFHLQFADGLEKIKNEKKKSPYQNAEDCSYKFLTSKRSHSFFLTGATIRRFLEDPFS